jgi:putative transposase
MPRRKVEFINGEIYHVIMRGVDRRQIFMDDEDRWRGIFGLYEFNNANSVTIREQREKRKQLKESIKQFSRDRDSGKLPRVPVSGENREIFNSESDPRKRLVDIFAFVFMQNHIHLLLRQRTHNGLSLFARKFGVGYAMYFNSKYERKGALFQGRFEAKIIGDDEYLKTIFLYIHTNPVSIINPGWKETGIKNVKEAIDFLEKYRWSSYLDYLSKNNFPSVSCRDFLSRIFIDKEQIRKSVKLKIINGGNNPFPESRSLEAGF